MSLSDVLNAKLQVWAQTPSGKKKLETAIKSGIGSSNSSLNISTQSYARRMKEILQELVSGIVSTTTGDDFLNYIDIDSSIKVVTVDGKPKLSVGLSFNRDYVMRDSLYPEKYGPVYMPAIVNNEWNITTQNRVYGRDRWGNFTVGTKSWIYSSDKGFMQRAVNRFNAEMSNSNAIAELSATYDGGVF